MRFRLPTAFHMYTPPISTCAFDRFSAFRMYCPSIPTCAFDLTLLSARTARQFLPALSISSHFPHVLLVDPYLRFRPHPVFRTYGPLISTCGFGFFPFSARTTRRFLPALSVSYRFPHVHPADSYLRLRPHPLSACTPRRALPALSVSYRFPHVQLAGSYLRFRPHPFFRTYTPPIPTCAFDLTPSSARTPRRFLHASPTTPRLSHVHPVNPYLRFRFPPIFRMYGSLTTYRSCTPYPRCWSKSSDRL